MDEPAVALLPPAEALAPAAGKLPVIPSPDFPPRPPAVPPPAWAVWLRPPMSDVPLPVTPGTASRPDEPGCGSERATPLGPPAGVSAADGAVSSRAFPVPGLPGAFGFPCTPLSQATSVSAASNARPPASAARIIRSSTPFDFTMDQADSDTSASSRRAPGTACSSCLRTRSRSPSAVRSRPLLRTFGNNSARSTLTWW